MDAVTQALAPVAKIVMPYVAVAQANVPAELVTLASVIGLATLVFGLLGWIGGLFWFWIRPYKDLRTLGDWAIVTGASDGIGKAIVGELVSRGVSVILVARNEEKLEAVVEEMTPRVRGADVEMQVCVIDFSSANQERDVLNKMKRAIKGKSIGVLYNNVGLSYQHAEFAEKLTVDEIQNMLRVNCMSTTLMTGLVLPGMKERKSGAVVCVSSGLAAVPSPLYAVYGATKAFVGSYANAVAVECARSNTNVSVQELSPFFVATKMARVRNATFFTPSPKTFAKSVVRMTGRSTTSRHALPYAPHAFQNYLLDLLPKSTVVSVLWSMHLGMYKAWERKMKRLAAKSE